MTNEELEAIRVRVADDVVLPTATTLAIIDDLKLCRDGWSKASSLATALAGQEAAWKARALAAEEALADKAKR